MNLPKTKKGLIKLLLSLIGEDIPKEHSSNQWKIGKVWGFNYRGKVIRQRISKL